jgi:hypothetical protein
VHRLSLTRHNDSSVLIARKRPATFVYCASCRCFQITEGEWNLLKLHNRADQKERVEVVYRSFNIFCAELTPCSIILPDNCYSEVLYIPHIHISQRFRDLVFTRNSNPEYSEFISESLTLHQPDQLGGWLRMYLVCMCIRNDVDIP